MPYRYFYLFHLKSNHVPHLALEKTKTHYFVPTDTRVTSSGRVTEGNGFRTEDTVFRMKRAVTKTLLMFGTSNIFQRISMNSFIDIDFLVALRDQQINQSSATGECLLDKYILAEGAFMFFDGKKW